MPLNKDLDGREPLGFDHSCLAALLEAVAPLCAVIADYQDNSWGRTYEADERMLGRIARAGEVAPYVTWGQLCSIADAVRDLTPDAQPGAPNE